MPEICLDWNEFEENFINNWKPKYKEDIKDRYSEDDGETVIIKYWYGDSATSNIVLYWTFSLREVDIYKIVYNGSSPFAGWWVSRTDGILSDED